MTRAARGDENHSEVAHEMLAREREARFAGPTPYQGLRRSDIVIEDQD